jgi:DNA primase
MFLDKFVEWAHQCLRDSDDAQTFLRSRGSSAEQWSRHKIGYIGGDFDVEYENYPGHSEICRDRDKKYLWCDACRYRRWSSIWEGEEGSPKEQIVGHRLDKCIVLPLTTYSGNFVGFQVRSTVEKAYDTFTLSKRPEAYFFGIKNAMSEIWRRKEVSIVEGPFDQLLFERLIDPAVIALATSAVSFSQVKFLKRFITKVNLCLDHDEAGRKGVKSFLEYSGLDFDVVNVKYPKLINKEKDIGDVWKRLGDGPISRHFRQEIL